ncbi:MAG: bifunctional 2-polyprenyl-6-hydroxyphenol methylase/3-demethylubiquinol 3-O-methyltransferase UbiG [Betaproteobacteria bacterium]|nr:bifunctional 2-polyprenyl-6-hydroxyphenol methylase/3-demethylubiquinol 3-O-methyltransferase UbiG [Betaproteobacteria bacterium]
MIITSRSTPALSNVDPAELQKFSELAHRWWDPNSEFKPLHDINPLRVDLLEQSVGLRGRRVLDVGCGGGILSEAMAQRGASVVGIDLAEKALNVARLHLLESGNEVDYRCVDAETLSHSEPSSFDVVTCMEMLEHVPDPAAIVQACARAAKPGATVVFSTINRTARGYLFAILGAEYVLKLLPRGTHRYDYFIRPSELSAWCRDADLHTLRVVGMSYNPLSRRYSLGNDTAVNYLLIASKGST